MCFTHKATDRKEFGPPFFPCDTVFGRTSSAHLEEPGDAPAEKRGVLNVANPKWLHSPSVCMLLERERETERERERDRERERERGRETDCLCALGPDFPWEKRGPRGLPLPNGLSSAGRLPLRELLGLGPGVAPSWRRARPRLGRSERLRRRRAVAPGARHGAAAELGAGGQRGPGGAAGAAGPSEWQPRKFTAGCEARSA